jgi:hypothetical protein
MLFLHHNARSCPKKVGPNKVTRQKSEEQKCFRIISMYMKVCERILEYGNDIVTYIKDI